MDRENRAGRSFSNARSNGKRRCPRKNPRNVGINVITAGVPSIGTYSVEGFDPIVTKTFVTQEMLKRGFIAGNALYASIEHTDQILDQYFSNLHSVFHEISKSGSTDELNKQLDDGPAQSGFQRLA